MQRGGRRTWLWLVFGSCRVPTPWQTPFPHVEGDRGCELFSGLLSGALVSARRISILSKKGPRPRSRP